MLYRPFVTAMHLSPFLIMFTWKVSTFSAMIYLSLLATYAEVNTAATAFPEAIVCYIPAAEAQRILFPNRFGSFVFSNPSLASEPSDQGFSRFQILRHRNFIHGALATGNAASRQFHIFHG